MNVSIQMKAALLLGVHICVLVAALLLPIDTEASQQSTPIKRISGSLYAYSSLHPKLIQPLLKNIGILQHLLQSRTIKTLIFYQIISLALAITLFKSITN